MKNRLPVDLGVPVTSEEKKDTALVKTLTLSKCCDPGPYLNDQTKWLNIARYMEMNREREAREYQRVSVNAFCSYSKLTEADILAAPSSKEYLDMTSALRQGRMILWLSDKSKDWQASIDNMIAARKDMKDGTEDAMKMDRAINDALLKVYDASGGAKVDLSILNPQGGKDASKLIGEVLDILKEIYGFYPSPQKAISELANGFSRKSKSSGQGGGEINTPAHADNPIGVPEEDRPAESLDTFPSPTEGAEQS